MDVYAFLPTKLPPASTPINLSKIQAARITCPRLHLRRSVLSKAPIPSAFA
jgi:hypothetical protein